MFFFLIHNQIIIQHINPINALIRYPLDESPPSSSSSSPSGSLSTGGAVHLDALQVDPVASQS
jgi:hypothetical protein